MTAKEQSPHMSSVVQKIPTDAIVTKAHPMSEVIVTSMTVCIFLFPCFVEIT